MAGALKYPACTLKGILEPLGQYKETFPHGVGADVPSDTQNNDSDPQRADQERLPPGTASSTHKYLLDNKCRHWRRGQQERLSTQDGTWTVVPRGTGSAALGTVETRGVAKGPAGAWLGSAGASRAVRALTTAHQSAAVGACGTVVASSTGTSARGRCLPCCSVAASRAQGAVEGPCNTVLARVAWLGHGRRIPTPAPSRTLQLRRRHRSSGAPIACRTGPRARCRRHHRRVAIATCGATTARSSTSQRVLSWPTDRCSRRGGSSKACVSSNTGPHAIRTRQSSVH